MKRLKKTFIIGMIMVCAVVSMIFMGSLGSKRTENAAIPETPSTGVTDPPVPVSYTHLDVYKRQRQGF